MRQPAELKQAKIGFIGTGFVGGNLADNFESRGYSVVRYSLDPRYVANKGKLKNCAIVFVAVPTPTKSGVFMDNALWEVLPMTPSGATVVIKSTVLPNTIHQLLAHFPDRFIMHSPEFLDVSTARENTDNPDRNIIGTPHQDDDEWYGRALEVLSVLPRAKFHLVCSPEESAMIKYGGNCFFYTKNVFFNVLHDICEQVGANWSKVHSGIVADPRIHPVHTRVVDKGGRGAGGACLPKDFAALIDLFMRTAGPNPDYATACLLHAVQGKNKSYLKATGKDPDIYAEVYGADPGEEVCRDGGKKV